MGQYASEPVVEKETTLQENDKLMVGASSMQGWRMNMEDFRTCKLDIPGNASFFAVFDGHGGPKIAEYASKHLIEHIIKNPNYELNDYEKCIKEAYLELDDIMRKDGNLFDDKSGTTAITVLIKDNKIICGNVGDSRAIVSINGRVTLLSRDHKPSLPDELARVEASGGFVSFDRVNGILAMSRALGDYSFKNNMDLPPEKQSISPEPEVKIVPITEDTDFILIASDGVWDVMNNQEAVDFVISQVHLNRYSPELICEQIFVKCLAPDSHSPLNACGLDNMTAILIVFLHPSPTSTPVASTEHTIHHDISHSQHHEVVTNESEHINQMKTAPHAHHDAMNFIKSAVQSIKDSVHHSGGTSPTSHHISDSSSLSSEDHKSPDKISERTAHEFDQLKIADKHDEALSNTLYQAWLDRCDRYYMQMVELRDKHGTISTNNDKVHQPQSPTPTKGSEHHVTNNLIASISDNQKWHGEKKEL